MISASLSLSLPRLGWKSTSMPRSLKIWTAAGDSASEMSTLGLDILPFLHLRIGRVGDAPNWGETGLISAPSPSLAGKGQGRRLTQPLEAKPWFRQTPNR